MNDADSTFFVFDTHAVAERAILTLSKSGFDMKKLSLLGSEYPSDEKPIGFYTAGDCIKAWEGVGAFWRGIWGLLIAPAIFVFPGIGVVAMAGPLATNLVDVLEGAASSSALSPLASTLTQIGMPKAQIINCEAALKAHKYLLVVHGSAKDRETARSVLVEAKLAIKSG